LKYHIIHIIIIIIIIIIVFSNLIIIFFFFTISKKRVLKRLSSFAWSEDLPMDIVVIGACQGWEDEFIFKFMTQTGWRGLFVEPDEGNFRRMEKYFHMKNVSKDRYRLVRAAISSECSSSREINFYKLRPSAAQLKQEHFNITAVANEMGSVNELMAASASKRFEGRSYFY
jgi:hypothetical protein